MVQSPTAPFDYVGSYQIPLNENYYEFCTLISQDGKLVWMPDSEQQHITFDYNGAGGPSRIIEAKEETFGKILIQIELFQTKKQPLLEDVLERHRDLIGQMLNDLRYQLRQ